MFRKTMWRILLINICIIVMTPIVMEIANMIVTGMDSNKECWICDKKFLHRNDRNLYFLELSSLSMFEIDILSDDSNSTTTAYLKDSVVVFRKGYENREYRVMNIQLKDDRSYLIGKEEAAKNICSECLSQIAIGQQGDVANYIIIDYRSGSLYSVPDEEVMNERVVGDYLIFAENVKDDIRLIIVYSPE